MATFAGKVAIGRDKRGIPRNMRIFATVNAYAAEYTVRDTIHAQNTRAALLRLAHGKLAAILDGYAEVFKMQRANVFAAARGNPRARKTFTGNILKGDTADRAFGRRRHFKRATDVGERYVAESDVGKRRVALGKIIGQEVKRSSSACDGNV